MESANGVQILDEAFYISFHDNDIGEGMNSTIIPPGMSK